MKENNGIASWVMRRIEPFVEKERKRLVCRYILLGREMKENVELSQKEKTHILELIAFAEREGFTIGDKEQFRENNYNLKKRLWYKR